MLKSQKHFVDRKEKQKENIQIIWIIFEIFLWGNPPCNKVINNNKLCNKIGLQNVIKHNKNCKNQGKGIKACQQLLRLQSDFSFLLLLTRSVCAYQPTGTPQRWCSMAWKTTTPSWSAFQSFLRHPFAGSFRGTTTGGKRSVWHLKKSTVCFMVRLYGCLRWAWLNILCLIFRFHQS